MANKTRKKKEQPFRFLDLPAELRCVVYHHVLESDCDVQLKFQGVGLYTRVGIKDSCEANISAEIVSVNKQLHKEAIPILYISNKFHTVFTDEISCFLKNIGESAQHLRHIGCDVPTTKGDIRAVLVRLKPAVQLSRLVLPANLVDASCRRRFSSAQKLAEQLTPLFRAMNRHQKKDEGRKARSLPDILCLKAYHWTDAKAVVRESHEARAKALESELRGLLADTLE